MEFLQNLIFFLDGVLYGSCGLIFVVMGVFISIRILDFPDLTVDGAFTLGAVIFARLVVEGFNPWATMVLAALAGITSSFSVHFLNTKIGIGKILSSVLILILLVSINSHILGQATIGLLQSNTIFKAVDEMDIELSKRFLPLSSYSVHLMSIILSMSIAGFFCLSFISS